MAQNVRVGFIGCGLIARSHARGVGSAVDAEIIAVHDIDPVRAASFAEDVAGTNNVVVPTADDVITSSDAVYVSTWTSAHPELVDRVAAAGKAIFCEKPLAVDYATASTMTELVMKAGVTNQVGLVLRNSPSFRWLRHRTALAGPLMNIVFRDDQYLPTQGLYQSTWRGDKDLAGAGTLLEHSIHDLDLLRWIMGPIESVCAQVGTVHGLDGIDDQASVLLQARSGAQATLTSVWHDVLSRPSQRRVEVFCQDAVLTLTGDWTGPVEVESNSGIESVGQNRLATMAADVDGLDLNPDAAFVEAVRSETQAYPDFAIALEAHQLADAAYRSAAAGGAAIKIAHP